MSSISTPGRVKEVTAPSNPLIKEIKALALKKNRDAGGLFIAEGQQLVVHAIEQGWHARQLVYATRKRDDKLLMALAARARAAGTDILEVSEKVLGAISRRDNPQMVIGVFEQHWKSVDAVLALAASPGDVVLALDRVRDPGNLGTIIRSCDAAGVRAIILVGETTDPYSLEAVRASMGSIFSLPLARCSEAEFVGRLSAFPGLSVGTHLKGARDYRGIDYGSLPVLAVMGNEQQGLGEAVAAACDDLAFIPMHGKAESLNLAVATGIMLFEIRRDFLVMPQEGLREPKGQAGERQQ